MKLIELKCKNCGAKLMVDPEVKDAHCEFCGIGFQLDDEVQHIKYVDMEQSGYEFEKGRIRAREEANAERAKKNSIEYKLSKKIADKATNKLINNMLKKIFK